MRKTAAWVLAAAVLVGGCGDGTSAGGITPTGPNFSGQTASVTVNCPNNLEPGQTGTCVAYGYDSNGLYTNSNVSSWSSSNTSKVTVGSGGGITAVATGTATITAVIDGISGTRSVTVINPNPVPVISYGPSSIRPNTTCEWMATVSGGTAPYTWDWSGGTTIFEYEDDYMARSSSSFTITLTVTDANGHTGTAYKNVSVSSGAPACLL